MVTLAGNAVRILIQATDQASAVVDGVKGKLGGLGGAMQKLRGPMLALGAASVGVAALSIKSFSDFEKKMADVTTLLGVGGNASEAYGETVNRLGTEFAVAGGKVGVAASLYQVVSAGFIDAAEASTVLETAVKASVGGSVEASVAITGLTQVLNAYGLEADQAESISDIMFQTVAKGVTTYEQLGSSLSTVLPTAASLGVNFETVSAALATLTQQGLSAAEATTSLNRMMLAFLKPSTEMSLALNEIANEQGILSVEVQNATSDYIAQQAELNSLTNAYTETTEAVSGMSAELDDMSDAMAVNRVKIQELRLTARQQGRELTESELEEIDKIKLANEELSLSYNKLKIDQDDLQETQVEQKNAMDAQTNSLESSGEVLQDLSASTGENLLKNLEFAEVLALVAEKADGSTTKMAEFFNQIRGLKGALGLTGANAENFSKKLEDMANAGGVAENAFTVMSETTSAKMQIMQNRLSDLAIRIGSALIPILEKMMPIIEKLIDLFAGLDPVIQVGILVVGAFAGAFALLWPVISAIIGLIGGAGGLGAIIAALSGPIGWIILAVGLLAAAWATNFLGIRDIAESVVNSIVGFWENILLPAFQILMDTVGAIFEAFKGNFEPLKDIVKETIIGMAFFLVEFAQGALKFGKMFVDNIIKGITGMGGAIVNALWNLIPEPFRTIIQTALSVGGQVAGGIARGIGTAWHELTGLAEGGLVTGPTLAMLGENNKKELVIPLEKLGDFGGKGTTVYIQKVEIGNDYDVDRFKRRLAEDDEDDWARRQNR